MITQQLINPKSIVIVGGSNDTTKPGGKVLKNLIDNHFPKKMRSRGSAVLKALMSYPNAIWPF
jgi:acyl-CoA synthetase (NDP forming)